MARLIDRLAGHLNVSRRLLNARAAGRLAPTLLFSGPAGIGKNLAALALTQALVCEGEASPCGACGPCLRVEKSLKDNGSSESLLQVAPDGAFIKIEQTRDILQFISLRRLGRARVVIIDQAHLLNPQAANALLKALEEPPAGTYFILITPMPSVVLPTIRSRAQHVRFGPLTSAEVKSVLARDPVGTVADDEVIASARGSVAVARRLCEDHEEYSEAMQAARAFLDALVNTAWGDRIPFTEIAQLREQMKERGTHGFIFHSLQGAVRDALCLQAGIGTLAPGAWAGAEQLAQSMTPENLAELSLASLGIEHDVQHNVDRGLVLENFAIRWRQLARMGDRP